MLKSIKSVTTTPRIIIEITGGVMPGEAIPEYTKRLTISSDAWFAQGIYENKPDAAKQEVLRVYGYAQEYMRDLMNPKVLNWVNLNWLYL